MAVWSEVIRTDLVNSGRFDSDYFKPEFISLDKILSSLDGRKLKHDVLLIKCGPFGSTIKKETYIKEGVIVARPFNINQLEFEQENLAYISYEDYRRKNLVKCIDKDIFFSRVGDVKVGILNNQEKKEITISPNIVLLRLNEGNISPEYTTVFFNTKYGLKQIIRAQKVVAQPTISTSLLNNLFVFNPGEEIQTEIENDFNKSMHLKMLSKSLYTQAQELLEQELGLDKLKFEKPVGYEASFSDILTTKRGDADFFNPQLKFYYDKLAQKFNLEKITSIANILKFGNPDYSKNGVPIITQKHLCEITPENYGKELFASNLWVNKYQNSILKQNDLLFYSVGAYLGKINIWLNNDQAVPASFITLIRAENQYDAGYLMVLL